VHLSGWTKPPLRRSTNMLLSSMHPLMMLSIADSCDVDQHSWLKPITIPAIPIKVGA
jgi:hypothetical protein